MNFAAITVELRETSEDRVNAYGLEYRSANAVIPASSGDNEVKLRVLCYNRSGPKLDAVLDWKVGTRALVTGYLMFSDDTAQPLDFVVTTFEPNIPQDMYCNQVVLGNAFFRDQMKSKNEIMEPLQSKLEQPLTMLMSAPGYLWNSMKAVSGNSTIESAKDVAFASMVTSVSTAKKVTRALTVQLSRTISPLAKSENDLVDLVRRGHCKGLWSRRRGPNTRLLIWITGSINTPKAPCVSLF